MGRRGPPPKPAKLKLMAGTFRKDRHAPNSPEPDVTAPDCPAWLPPQARAEWGRIAPELLSLGLLSRIDRSALANYCVAVSETELATKALEAEGRVVRSPILDKQGEVVGHRLKAHPAVAMQRSAMALAKSFLSEFGLSPASRTRVSGSAPCGGGDDKGSRFFGVS